MQYRITMAAVDPNEPPMPGPDDKVSATARSTLRIIRVPVDEESDDEDSDDDDGFRAFLERGDESDDDSNGGPSDLGKAKQKKQEAALRKLMEAAQAEEDSDEEMEDIKPKGKGKGKASQQSKKGKEKAAPIEEDKDDDDESDDCGDDCDSDDDEAPLEQFVLCTLDNEKVRTRESTLVPTTVD
jgi:FK506-binding nuclear protein